MVLLEREIKFAPSKKLEAPKRSYGGGGWRLRQMIKEDAIKMFKKCPEHFLGCACMQPRRLFN